MILVLLGTQNNSFERLLKKIEECIKNKTISDEVIVQAGYTKFDSKYMKIFNFISTEDLQNLQSRADLIISHGGVGSIVSSLKMNKKVIAVPRLHEYGEHVNDHQKDIVKYFGMKKYIISCCNLDDFNKAISGINNFIPQEYKCGTSKIINIIDSYINNN